MAGSEQNGKKRRAFFGRDDGRSRRPRADWDAGSAHALAVADQGYNLLQQTERTLRLVAHMAVTEGERRMWEQIAHLPCQLFAGYHAQQMMDMQREMEKASLIDEMVSVHFIFGTWVPTQLPP